MSKDLQTTLSIQLTDTELNKVTRFQDDMITNTVISHETGEMTVQAGQVNQQIGSQINIMSMFSEKPFSLKVGGTGNPEHTNIKMFSYNGDITDFFVSNPGSESITVRFTSAKIQ